MVSRKLWHPIYPNYLILLIAILDFSNVKAESPQIQLNSIGGGIGVIGDFAGLSPVSTDITPQQFGLSPHETSNNQIIISKTVGDAPLRVFQSLASIQGSISTFCKLSDNRYILGGNFHQINNSDFNHIVEYNSQTNQFLPLQQGLNGPVKTLYCDTSTNTVYVGGDFVSALSSNGDISNFTGHAASFKDNQWVPLPWKGFNGAVNAIIKTKNLLQQAPNSEAIIFGGRFNSTGDGQYVDQLLNNFTQPINLKSATIFGGNGEQFGNNTNPSSVVCSQSPWLLQKGVPGYWQAQFVFPIRPTLFRITNAHTADGRNTNAFNIISLGSNEYFQLSYHDPATNQPMTCTEQCYLSNDSSVAYQDFTVLQPITTDGIRINIDTWYGESGGLGGVSIYNSDATLQPTNTNSASSGDVCGSTTTTSSPPLPSSSVTTTGNWTQRFSYDSYQTFLISTINTADLATSDVSVTYQPYIAAQGYYDVYTSTPGCVGTSTCHQRTQVQLTLNLTPDNTSTVILDQNIVSDERVLIYSGPIADSSSSASFKPTITMKVAPNATDASTGTVTVFGSAIDFMRNSTLSSLSSILVYFPQNNTWTPLPHQLPLGSMVNTIQSNDAGTLYIGGQFQMNSTSNINNASSNVAIYNYGKEYLPVSGNGLNGAVLTSILAGSSLIVGGTFNNSIVPQQSNNLTHVGIYDLQANTWSGMQQGVNGNVEYLYTNSDGLVHLSGPFNSTVSSIQSRALYNNAEYDVNQHRFSTPKTFIDGIIANQVDISPNATLYLGSIKDAQTYYANNLAFVPSTFNSQKDKPFASIASSLTTPTTQLISDALITAAAYYKPNNSAITSNSSFMIIAGSFYINNTLCNVAMYDPQQNSWKQPCILQDMRNSSITTLFIVKDYLFIGGHFSSTKVLNSTTDNNGIASTATSIALYNLQSQSLEGITGVFLDDRQQQPGSVNVFYSQDDGKKIYVGGQFAYAGLLNCNGVCLFSMETRQWTQVADTDQSLSGTVNDMFINDHGIMTVVGDLSISKDQQQTKTPLATFDTTAKNNGSKNKKRSTVATSSALNDLGGIFIPTSLLYDLDSNFIIAGKQQQQGQNGSHYSIISFNGQKWSLMDTKLGPSSVINQLLWMPMDPDSAKSLPRYPADSDSMLMAVGQLQLPQGETVSAAFYDGFQWYPYFITNKGSQIKRVFTALPCCTAALATRHYLSVPAVILVSIAISLGILFCLTALAFLYLFINHRHHPAFYRYDLLDAYAAGAGTTAAGATAAGVVGTNTMKKDWKPKHRPTSLLAMIDAAALTAAGINGGSSTGTDGHNQRASFTSPEIGYSSAINNNNVRNSIDISDGTITAATASAAAAAAAAAGATKRFRNSSYSNGTSSTARPFSALMMAALKNDSLQNDNDKTLPPISEDAPCIFYAKYPFEAKEIGELAFEAHTPIVVTDTTDNVWWMGYKEDETGNAVSGLFPSNYVTKKKPAF